MRGSNSLLNQPFGLSTIAEQIKKCIEPADKPNTLQVNNIELRYTENPLIMGILNVTPDSFSDGGIYSSAEEAAGIAILMEKQGASVIDVGGESTRPGSLPVSAGEQLARVVPVIKAIRKETAVPISIDSCIPEVVKAAVRAGAGMINSIDALESPGMLELAVSLGLPVVLMHMKGIPETMQANPSYRDAPTEIAHYLQTRVECLVTRGLPREMIIVDPGIGFGKRLEDNIALIHSLDWIGRTTGCRVLLGHSRKSFLGTVSGIKKADQRDSVTHLVTALSSGADIIRVHDVPGTVTSIKVSNALRNSL
ncbi:MAG: dihydropteroate synthase [bacterium]|nr:dihydropteroate synthase [bacterium]